MDSPASAMLAAGVRRNRLDEHFGFSSALVTVTSALDSLNKQLVSKPTSQARPDCGLHFLPNPILPSINAMKGNTSWGRH